MAGANQRNNLRVFITPSLHSKRLNSNPNATKYRPSRLESVSVERSSLGIGLKVSRSLRVNVSALDRSTKFVWTLVLVVIGTRQMKEPTCQDLRASTQATHQD